MNLRPFLAVAMLTLSGCATLHNGRHQKVSVVTDPAGAAVQVQCGKVQTEAVTPTTVRLPRRFESCSLTVTRPGFRSETVVFDQHPSHWVWGNFAAPVAGVVAGGAGKQILQTPEFWLGYISGGLGFALDALTGAVWKLEPAKVELKLAAE